MRVLEAETRLAPHPATDRHQGPWDPDAGTDLAAAIEFVGRFHAMYPGLCPINTRLADIRRQIEQTGTYTHTREELTFGARLAIDNLLNANALDGNQPYPPRRLVVRDLRHVTGREEIVAELANHLITAGRRPSDPIRSVMSIFAPAVPGQQPPRLWNANLVDTAGYRAKDGTVTGNPATVELTRTMQAYGWRSAGTATDVLPIMVDVEGEPLAPLELPPVLTASSPEEEPPVRVISNLRLCIGGVHYPMAPFNLEPQIAQTMLAGPLAGPVGQWSVGPLADQMPVGQMPVGPLAGPAEAMLFCDQIAVELSTRGRAPVVPPAQQLPAVPGLRHR